MILLQFTARMDYEPIIEIITFSSEQLMATVTVPIKDDMNVEFDESFFLYLVSGEGVHLSPFSRAEVTIQNDDGKKTFSTYIIQFDVLYNL